jgi:hypothetical protein
MVRAFSFLQRLSNGGPTLKTNYLLPLALLVLTNACIIVNPKDIDTSLDPTFKQTNGTTATIEVSRPDKFSGMKAVYIVMENDSIVGTLANAGTLAWKSSEGKKVIKLEWVQPINCRIFPGRDDKCFEDKKNQYVRTDLGKTHSITFDLKEGQTCKVKFEPQMFGEGLLTYSMDASNP